nr:hypothetical protein [Methylocella silvestris]
MTSQKGCGWDRRDDHRPSGIGECKFVIPMYSGFEFAARPRHSRLGTLQGGSDVERKRRRTGSRLKEGNIYALRRFLAAKGLVDQRAGNKRHPNETCEVAAAILRRIVRKPQRKFGRQQKDN